MVLRLFLFGLALSIIFWIFFKRLPARRANIADIDDPLSGIPTGDLKNLRSICRGDLELMSRLVERERSCHPQISSQEACRRVIMSYRRDNR